MKNNKKIFLKLFIIIAVFGLGFFAFSAQASAATYYVAMNGSDDNNGISPSSAWKSIDKINKRTFVPGDSILFKRGDVWRERLTIPSSGNSLAPITFGAYGTGEKPLLLGSVSKNNPGDWTNIGTNLWATADNSFPYDTGFMILGPDNTASVGTKFWKLSDLDVEREFWYDDGKKRVVVYSDQNPAVKYAPIEIASPRWRYDVLIKVGSRRYIHIEDLALKYVDTLAIDINGGAQNIEIRNCDIGFIGGGWHGIYSGINNRYGNAIQIWNSAHDIIVDGCKIWQVFDAAVTFQAVDPGINQYNISFTNNIIWYSEYSYELFNYGAGSSSSNNRFEGNMCIGAGWGWGHDRRSDADPAAAYHVRAVDLRTPTSRTYKDLYLTKNIYYEAKDSLVLQGISGINNLSMDYNYYYQKSGDMINYLYNKYPMSQFAAYQSYSGKDQNSVTGDKIAIQNAARSKVSGENIPLINRLFQEVDGNCEGVVCMACMDNDEDGYGAVGTDLTGCATSITTEDCDDNDSTLDVNCSIDTTPPSSPSGVSVQ